MSVASNEGQVQGDDSIRAETKDGQEVIIDASVIYQIDPHKVVPLHVIWQKRYEDGLVPPEARGSIRTLTDFRYEQVV